jgi:phosphoglycolate phosphatase
MKGRISAVVFDLDGTLIDSAPDVAAALNRALAAEGRRPLSLSEVQQLVGEGAKPLIRRAWAATGPELPEADLPAALERYLGEYAARPSEHTVVYDGVIEVLDRLEAEGLTLAVCTNKPSIMTRLVLEALGWSGRFRAVVGGDDTAYPKPDGRHVLETLERMGHGVEGAVYVGDSATDVAAARAAGLPVVAVRWGYARMEPEALGADLLIDRFADLPEALTRLTEAQS